MKVKVRKTLYIRIMEPEEGYPMDLNSVNVFDTEEKASNIWYNNPHPTPAERLDWVRVVKRTIEFYVEV